MPTYVYECPRCQHRIELEQSITATFRPSCHSGCVVGTNDELPVMERVIQPVGFTLKGTGWAKDGYSK